MKKAREAAADAEDNYKRALKAAKESWADEKELYPGKTFWEWARTEAPDLNQAVKQRKEAYNEVDSASQLYDGPQAATLQGIRTNLRSAQDTLTHFPG